MLDFTQAEPYREECAHDTHEVIKETKRGVYYREYHSGYRYVPYCAICAELCIDPDDHDHDEEDVYTVTAEDMRGIIGEYADEGDHICDHCVKVLKHGTT